MLTGCFECDGKTRKVYTTDTGTVYVCVKCGAKWEVTDVKDGYVKQIWGNAA